MAATDDRISTVLAGIDFPAHKEKILHHAANHGADPDLQHHLQRIPNVTYAHLGDVLKAVPRTP